MKAQGFEWENNVPMEQRRIIFFQHDTKRPLKPSFARQWVIWWEQNCALCSFSVYSSRIKQKGKQHEDKRKRNALPFCSAWKILAINIGGVPMKLILFYNVVFSKHILIYFLHITSICLSNRICVLKAVTPKAQETFYVLPRPLWMYTIWTVSLSRQEMKEHWSHGFSRKEITDLCVQG